MNDWLHNLPVAVDGPSSLWRYVPELDTIPAVKPRELVRRATSGTSTRGKLKLLGIAERINIRGGVRRTCDTNDTELMAGDIVAIPKRRMVAKLPQVHSLIR